MGINYIIVLSFKLYTIFSKCIKDVLINNRNVPYNNNKRKKKWKCAAKNNDFVILFI